MSQPEHSWPFQSLWSRAGLVATAIGMSGLLVAMGMVFYGLFTRPPGGEQALASARLTPTEGWEPLYELPLEAGERVEFWEVQSPPAEGSGGGFSVVVRAPSGEDKAPERSGSSHVSVGGTRAEYRGGFDAHEGGVHQVEVDVRGLPRGHEISLAAHAPGTIGPDWSWAGGMIAFGLLGALGGVLCSAEIVRWLIERVSAA